MNSRKTWNAQVVHLRTQCLGFRWCVWHSGSDVCFKSGWRAVQSQAGTFCCWDSSHFKNYWNVFPLFTKKNLSFYVQWHLTVNWNPGSKNIIRPMLPEQRVCRTLIHTVILCSCCQSRTACTCAGVSWLSHTCLHGLKNRQGVYCSLGIPIKDWKIFTQSPECPKNPCRHVCVCDRNRGCTWLAPVWTNLLQYHYSYPLVQNYPLFSFTNKRCAASLLV
jgi:hypothetical protein